MAASRKPTTTLSCHDLLSKKSWKSIPSIVVLAGDAQFFKSQVVARLTSELFGAESPQVRRLQGPQNESKESDLPLHEVLDDLRTPSFFSPLTLVVIERGDAFLKIHRESLEPFLEEGFAAGRLVIELRGKLDKRTKFVKTLAKSGWIVNCPQPYDRPPPWDTRSPAWDSELSQWVVRHAAAKGLELTPQVAYTLHDRVGSELSVIDEELEKIKTFLAAEGRARIDDEAVTAVTGDLREDSLFSVVDLFLEGRRRDTTLAVDRLFRKGYHNETGALVLDPNAIALPLLGSLLARLRSIRRAHAMSAEGASSDDWMREGLVKKPFLSRFQRQLRATPLPRVRRLIDRLYHTDRSIKTGSDARHLLLLLVAE